LKKIRIDSIARRNAGISIGDQVTIVKSKARAIEAKKIVVVPIEKQVPPVNERALGDALESILVTVGDIVRVAFMWSDGIIEFKIVKVTPSARQDVPFVVTQNTKFSVE